MEWVGKNNRKHRGQIIEWNYKVEEAVSSAVKGIETRPELYEFNCSSKNLNWLLGLFRLYIRAISDGRVLKRKSSRHCKRLASMQR